MGKHAYVYGVQIHFMKQVFLYRKLVVEVSDVTAAINLNDTLTVYVRSLGKAYR